MSKSIAKARKKWSEDEYDDFDRVFISKNKKLTENVEVKKTKKRTFTNLKHISRDQLMDMYANDEDMY